MSVSSRRLILSILTVLVVLPAASADEPRRLTAPELDAVVRQDVPHLAPSAVSDEQFLRRASLDLIGRPPTVEEQHAFLQDSSADRRVRLINRLLDSKEFGENWANYWSDTISTHVPPPELNFLSYRPLKTWFAARFNGGARWDEITREILTASGVVKDNPAATFVGYHRGLPPKLAAETARIFLGIQLQCAECHNHKFDRWKRTDFHSLAAFFARSSGNLGGVGANQDGIATVVKDKGKGEYEMPNAVNPKVKGTQMIPTFLTGEVLGKDKSDAERREFLAEQITRPDNPWFAKAYVNRIWSRLMGRGFYEPVDDMADYRDHFLAKTHDALAGHFTAAGFDVKDLFRLVMSTQSYQRQDPLGLACTKENVPPAIADKLRGEQVYQSLKLATGLPDYRPPAVKATGAFRFPPPPKSTCELIADKFSFDPSYAPEEVSRTLGQAMLLMNNDQIQKTINADSASGTPLSKLLQQERDNRSAFVTLFQQVLARRPTDREIGIAMDHIASVDDRGAAFEDLLWSLINSAEFTTRR
jgi:hypothetical protein